MNTLKPICWLYWLGGKINSICLINSWLWSQLGFGIFLHLAQQIKKISLHFVIPAFCLLNIWTLESFVFFTASVHGSGWESAEPMSSFPRLLQFGDQSLFSQELPSVLPLRHGSEAIVSHHMLSKLSFILASAWRWLFYHCAVKVHVQTDKQPVTETHVNAIQQLCTNSQKFLHLWLEAASNQETVLVCSQKK